MCLSEQGGCFEWVELNQNYRPKSIFRHLNVFYILVYKIPPHKVMHTNRFQNLTRHFQTGEHLLGHCQRHVTIKCPCASKSQEKTAALWSLGEQCYVQFYSFITVHRHTWTNQCLRKEGKPGNEVSDETKPPIIIFHDFRELPHVENCPTFVHSLMPQASSYLEIKSCKFKIWIFLSSCLYLCAITAALEADCHMWNLS